MMDSIEVLVKIREELVGIKTSLDYHIKRTDLLEDKVEAHERFMNKALGALIIIGFLSALPSILSLWEKFH